MKKKIFIVEDDEAIRESLIELLEGEGYEISAAEDGQVAIDHLQSMVELPNLILLDLMMPIKDGFQFCIEKEQNEKLSRIPVVIMSADGQIKEKQEQARASGYIRKPVDIDEILRAVRRHCN